MYKPTKFIEVAPGEFSPQDDSGTSWMTFREGDVRPWGDKKFRTEQHEDGNDAQVSDGRADLDLYRHMIDSGLPVEYLPESYHAEQSRQAAKADRDARLAAMVHTTEAGDVIQCRPIDEQNMRGAIEQMNRLGQTERQWIGADNALVTVTPDDLRAAIDSGQDQAAMIYAEYMGAL